MGRPASSASRTSGLRGSTARPAPRPQFEGRRVVGGWLRATKLRPCGNFRPFCLDGDRANWANVAGAPRSAPETACLAQNLPQSRTFVAGLDLLTGLVARFPYRRTSKTPNRPRRLRSRHTRIALWVACAGGYAPCPPTMTLPLLRISPPSAPFDSRTVVGAPCLRQTSHGLISAAHLPASARRRGFRAYVRIVRGAGCLPTSC